MMVNEERVHTFLVHQMSPLKYVFVALGIFIAVSFLAMAIIFFIKTLFTNAKIFSHKLYI